jgi:hypothetical protein
MRVVHEGDGVAYLERGELPADVAVVTSLPDVSELGLPEAAWRSWFVAVAEKACRAVGDRSVAVFFQSDVTREGRWIDKGHLVHLGADAAGAACLFHKIACRAPPGTPTPGRPAFARLLGFSRGLRLDATTTADVLPRLGAMPWRRAMGVAACEATCRFLLDHTDCREVLDPFCGMGTMLAVAEAYGLRATGVELSPRRAARARTLQVRLGAPPPVASLASAPALEEPRSR